MKTLNNELNNNIYFIRYIIIEREIFKANIFILMID